MNLQCSLRRLALHWVGAFLDVRVARGVANLPRYFADWWRYTHLAGSEPLRWKESYPCLTDRTAYTPFDAHYFYQASWAAQKIATALPAWHLDIGSSVAMIGIISASTPTVFVDYRPLRVTVLGLQTVAGDILALPLARGSLHSLSCLHVIEHIGLGRYGDALDPRGSIKAARELTRVLATGGRLLVSAPVGRERVQFNAHRIFAPATVLSMFAGLELVSFAMVDDEGAFHARASTEYASHCEYACGMFEFVKRS